MLRVLKVKQSSSMLWAKQLRNYEVSQAVISVVVSQAVMSVVSVRCVVGGGSV